MNELKREGALAEGARRARGFLVLLEKVGRCRDTPDERAPDVQSMY
ncbi:MAG: hypothetical protein ACE5JS_01175 [Nitrospinota bacterium]